MIVRGSYLLAISLCAGCRLMGPASSSKVSVQKTLEKWYTVEYFSQSVSGDPQIEDLKTDDAVRLFQSDFPFTGRKGEWVRYANDRKKAGNWVEFRQKPCARIKRLSPSHLLVEVVEGIHPPSRKKPYDRRRRLKYYMVPRSTELDKLFSARTLEAKFAYTFKRIGQGSTVDVFRLNRPGVRRAMRTDDVFRAFGQHDRIKHFGPTHIQAVYYEKEDVHIFCVRGKVYYIERGKPYWVKEQEKHESEKDDGTA